MHHEDRLPFAPLTERFGRVFVPCPVRNHETERLHEFPGDMDWRPINGSPIRVLSELTGINERTLWRWTQDGIRPSDADRIACLLGFHVSEIWPEWFDEEI